MKSTTASFIGALAWGFGIATLLAWVLAAVLRAPLAARGLHLSALELFVILYLLLAAYLGYSIGVLRFMYLPFWTWGYIWRAAFPLVMVQSLGDWFLPMFARERRPYVLLAALLLAPWVFVLLEVRSAEYRRRNPKPDEP